MKYTVFVEENFCMGYMYFQDLYEIEDNDEDTDFKFVRDKNDHYAEAYADFLGEIFKSSVSHKGTSKF